MGFEPTLLFGLSNMKDSNLGYRVQGSKLRVKGLGFRVQGLGFRVQDYGFRV